MTVVDLKDKCRDRGLKVSGTKKELVDRLDLDEDERLSHPAPRVMDAKGLKLNSYLSGVVKDIILSSGGSLGSRDLGRFLQKVPPSPAGARGSTALKELKEQHGNIKRFLDENRELFQYQVSNPSIAFNASRRANSLSTTFSPLPNNTVNPPLTRTQTRGTFILAIMGSKLDWRKQANRRKGNRRD
jgi:hypothetical protein